MESLNWCGVAEALAKEGELVEAIEAVDENLICFSAEGHELAARANLKVHHFVGVGDLGHGLGLVAVPEQDWASRTSCHQLELVVPSLTHGCVEAVSGLAHLHALFLLEVVGANRAVSTARVDDL